MSRNQECNVTVRSFPSNFTATAFGYKAMPIFAVENADEMAKPTRVEFGSPLAKPRAGAQGVAN